MAQAGNRVRRLRDRAFDDRWPRLPRSTWSDAAPRRCRPRSSPCSARRRLRARRRSPGCRPQSRRRSTGGCPTRRAAPLHTTGRPGRDPRPTIRIASISFRSRSSGSRPRCSRNTVSANDAWRISAVTSWPWIQIADFLRPHDCRSPLVHEARIITAFRAPQHVCNGSDTVTFLLRRGADATVPSSREVCHLLVEAAWRRRWERRKQSDPSGSR